MTTTYSKTELIPSKHRHTITEINRIFMWYQETYLNTIPPRFAVHI